ncbi:serine protease, partial [Thermus sp.]
MARLRLGLLGLLLLAAFLAWRAAPEVFWTLPAGAEGEALERVYREAHPAVFRVEVAEGPRGTGFFVGKDEALTAYHVVAGKREVVLYTAAGTRLKARVVGFSEPRDLAYLKAEGEGPRALPLGPLTPPRPGEAVLHIGNGRGEFLAPRYGRVLRLEASPSPFLPQGLVETSLPLAPGDSGGPVLNREGRVLGVAVAIGAT